MPRLLLTIAYDGRPFRGWQSQATGNTIQDVLEAAIARLQPDNPVRVYSSGRTDTGVHAAGQRAHFDSSPECRMDSGAWQRALNVKLPPAIRIVKCEEVAHDFHARYDATGKFYEYRIWNGPVLPPLEAGLAWHYPHQLDLPALRAAAALFTGSHDFSGFAANRGNEDGTEDFVRTVWSLDTALHGELITLTFHGSGFLYRMVRLMTGALIRIACGRADLPWLDDLVQRRVPDKCQYLAPPDGLTLVRVEYGDALKPTHPPG